MPILVNSVKELREQNVAKREELSKLKEELEDQRRLLEQLVARSSTGK